MDPNKFAIKRIIAMDKEIVVTKPPYPRDYCVVPDEHVWVEGDQGIHTYDSNQYGPVCLHSID